MSRTRPRSNRGKKPGKTSTRYSSSNHPMNTFYLKGYAAAQEAYHKGARTKADAQRLGAPAAWFRSTSEAGKAFRAGFDLAWGAAAEYIRRDRAGDDGATLRWNRGKKKAPTKTVYYWKIGGGYACRPTSTGVIKFETLKALKTFMARYFGDRYVVTFSQGSASESKIAANPRKNRGYGRY